MEEHAELTYDQPILLSLTPLLVSGERTAAMLGISVRTLYKLDVTERVPAPIRIGRRALWAVADLEQWVAAGCPTRERWIAEKEHLRAQAEKNRGASAR